MQVLANANAKTRVLVNKQPDKRRMNERMNNKTLMSLRVRKVQTSCIELQRISRKISLICVFLSVSLV